MHSISWMRYFYHTESKDHVSEEITVVDHTCRFSGDIKYRCWVYLHESPCNNL